MLLSKNCGYMIGVAQQELWVHDWCCSDYIYTYMYVLLKLVLLRLYLYIHACVAQIILLVLLSKNYGYMIGVAQIIFIHTCMCCSSWCCSDYIIGVAQQELWVHDWCCSARIMGT